jgi:hypothetical protein
MAAGNKIDSAKSDRFIIKATIAAEKLYVDLGVGIAAAFRKAAS